MENWKEGINAEEDKYLYPPTPNTQIQIYPPNNPMDGYPLDNL